MAITRAPAAGSRPYTDGRTSLFGAGMERHDDPYAAGTSYPPAGSGMNGYHPAPPGTPVRVATRDREYTTGGAGPGGAGIASTTVSVGPQGGTSVGHAQSMASDGQYKLRAKALYAYTASPDDPNEISFVKGEILDIMDASGKWWQCRNQNGQIGICPSNYVQLLS
ncbi:hypothetical protein QFC19_003673 [Naganishia cerealis]|uniref:Uncharacterized protein n=1 Tax=Naganishia cerealis TaxID=610337 RepID=A0ACC2W1S1_9TREE|nr:hypothetical protein QFC19_003673 [Naganishia cerealis]